MWTLATYSESPFEVHEVYEFIELEIHNYEMRLAQHPFQILKSKSIVP